jgi:hypothetical protein
VNGEDLYGCIPLHYVCDLHLLESSLLSGEDVDATDDHKEENNHPMKIIFFVRHCQNLRIFSCVNGF